MPVIKSRVNMDPAWRLRKARRQSRVDMGSENHFALQGLTAGLRRGYKNLIDHIVIVHGEVVNRYGPRRIRTRGGTAEGMEDKRGRERHLRA